MDSWLIDLRLAWRSLAKSPSFTVVAVLTLALGIGANTTLFSVLHGVLLRPLPYPDSERLAIIWNELGKGGAQSLPAVSAADYRDYPRMTELFEDFAAATGARTVGLSGILTGDGAPEKVDLSPVSANFFPMLGVDPARGRHFAAEEEVHEGPKVALLSHELWQRRFGGDPALVGRSIEIDGLPHEVIGILPEGFRLHLPAEAFRLKHSDVWTLLQYDYDDAPPRNYTTFSVFAKLKPDVSFARAQEEMERVEAELRATHPVHAASHLQIRVVPLQQDVVKGVRPVLLALMGAVGFVLLIVCANLANLMLVRGAERGREMAIQAALGAGSGRLVRRLLAESAILAGLGAVLAIFVSRGALDALVALRPADLPRLGEISIDGTVLAFTAGTAIVTAFLFGMLPAAQGTRVDLASILRASSRAGGGRRQHRTRQALVVGEIGLSLVLLIGVGLMIQSFAALRQVDPGFEPEGVLTFRVELPRGQYPDPEARSAFFDTLEERALALPGTTHFGAISQLPLSGSGALQPYAYDEETARDWESVTADGRWATPGYFQAMGTRVLSGRPFSHQDRTREDGAEPIIVIDEVVARRAFAGRSAVGQLLQVEPSSDETPYARVIGVVEHIRAHDLSRELWGQIYRPGWNGGSRNIALRTEGDPSSLIRPIEALVAELDPELPVIDLRPLGVYLEGASSQARFSLLLMGLFGLLAVVLVAIGIYGVVSYSVGLRRREFAVRLALGELPEGLARRVVGQGLALVLLAAALGIAGSLLLTRYLADLLYGVAPNDPVTIGAAAFVLAAVAIAACYLPARRAAKLEPATVLREE